MIAGMVLMIFIFCSGDDDDNDGFDSGSVLDDDFGGDGGNVLGLV